MSKLRCRTDNKTPINCNTIFSDHGINACLFPSFVIDSPLDLPFQFMDYHETRIGHREIYKFAHAGLSMFEAMRLRLILRTGFGVVSTTIRILFKYMLNLQSPYCGLLACCAIKKSAVLNILNKLLISTDIRRALFQDDFRFILHFFLLSDLRITYL